jgi:hypothetical protein
VGEWHVASPYTFSATRYTIYAMKNFNRNTLVLLFAAALLLVDALQHRPVHAAGTLKVYVQAVPDKRWTDIQGTEIVGFSCGPATRSAGQGTGADCFVASR